MRWKTTEKVRKGQEVAVSGKTGTLGGHYKGGMINLVILIPVALFLGGLGLAAFFWALRSGQFDDLDGAALRILDDSDEDGPSPSDQAVPRS